MKSKHLAAKSLMVFTVLFCFLFSACETQTTSEDVYYTVKYETSHGTAPVSIQVASGTVLKGSDLPVITADGWTFEGWYIGTSQITEGLSYPVTGDITLTAKWKQKEAVVVVNPPVVKYSIEYVSERGQCPETVEVSAGTVLNATYLPALEAYNWTFEGWYIGESKITSSLNYAVNSNITLTAKWKYSATPVSCTITYSSDYGTIPASLTVNSGTVLTANNLPTLSADGHIFGGWYVGSTKIEPGYTVTTTMTLTAFWGTGTPEPVYFTVSYVPGNNSTIPSKDVESNTILTAEDLPVLTREGYKFEGWFCNNNQITADSQYHVLSDMTLTAMWTAYCTINYSANRGAVPESKQVLEGYKLSASDLQSLSVDGYEFDGWYIGTTKITATQNYEVTSNITLTAKWLYTVTYSTTQGTTPQTQKVLSGNAIGADNLPTLAAVDDYSFGGWYIGTTKITADYLVTDNITLTASWLQSGINISVTANNELTQDEIDFAVTAVKSGDDYILTATAGYDFYLWSVDETNLYNEDYFFYSDEVEEIQGSSNFVIPDVLKSNTLTFNESNLPKYVSADGTYVVYVQAFRKVPTSQTGNQNQPVYVYKRAGLVFTVIKM